MGEVAELSVVVPVVNTLVDVTCVLEALEREKSDVRLEVIAVNRLGSRTHDAVTALFPWVQIVDVDDNATIPRMRQIAFEMATGDAVAVIEDHVIVPDGWARQMLDKLAEGHEVVGGSVENAATDNLLDWACFLCEYSHCIPPIDAGSVAWLTGNNVVYKKSVLDKHKDVLDPTRWEDHLHNTLKERGVDLFCDPDIVVGHKKHYTMMEYLTQRYLYARSFAGARVQDAGLTKRFVYGAASAALPPVLMYRTVSRIVKKRKHLGLLARSLPMISLFVASWGAGEVVGSWFGPGDALSKVC